MKEEFYEGILYFSLFTLVDFVFFPLTWAEWGAYAYFNKSQGGYVPTFEPYEMYPYMTQTTGSQGELCPERNPNKSVLFGNKKTKS